MDSDSELREHLIDLLRGGKAHATFDQTVDGFPVDLIAVRPAGMPHSAWELLEHLRITQLDILLFSTLAQYASPQWPEGYWPAAVGPERAEQWADSGFSRRFRAKKGPLEGLNI